MWPLASRPEAGSAQATQQLQQEQPWQRPARALVSPPPLGRQRQRRPQPRPPAPPPLRVGTRRRGRGKGAVCETGTRGRGVPPYAHPTPPRAARPVLCTQAARAPQRRPWCPCPTPPSHPTLSKSSAPPIPHHSPPPPQVEAARRSRARGCPPLPAPPPPKVPRPIPIAQPNPRDAAHSNATRGRGGEGRGRIEGTPTRAPLAAPPNLLRRTPLVLPADLLLLLLRHTIGDVAGSAAAAAASESGPGPCPLARRAAPTPRRGHPPTRRREVVLDVERLPDLLRRLACARVK